MNPKWLKQNGVLVGISVVWLVALGLIVWLYFRTAGHTDEITQQLESQKTQLQSILNTKPPPSQENVEILRGSREQIEQQYGQLHRAVCIGSLQIQDAERPIDFSVQLARRNGLMRQRARQANVKVPDNFAFGFSRYESVPPATEDKAVLGLLTKQLAVIEKLADTLFTSRIDEIRSIKRAEVDPGGSNNDVLNAAITNDPKALYQVLPFEIEFACAAPALRDFLNRLAVLDCFFTVRTVHLTTEEVQSSVSEIPGTPRKVAVAAHENAKVVARCRIDLVEFLAEPATPAAK